MGFKYLGESRHLQSLVNEDTVLFDMSNKNGQKIFFSSRLFVLLVEWF